MDITALVTLWILSVTFFVGFCGTEEINPEEVDKSTKAMKTRLKEMGNAGMLQDKKLDEKLDNINKNIDSLKGKPVPGEKEVNAISNAVSGLPELIAGIQTKNYVAIITGSLKVTAAICVLIPPLAPFSAIGLTILKTLTTLMSLFSSSSKEVAEDPIKSALRKFRVEGLKDEIAAVTYSWQVMISSISKFEDFINSNEVITSDLAMELYSNSFKSVGIFGKLRGFIVENCISANHNDATNGEGFINTCLDLTTRYSQLTSSRNMILVRMAGIVNVAETYYKDQQKNGVKEKEMMQIKMNFIHLALKQKEIDKEVLGFLTDPLNSFRSKRVIYEMFHKPYQYTELLSCLHTLDNQFNGMIDNDNVILCPEEKLGGLCRQMPVSDGFKDWDYSVVPTKSWFVPKGLMLSAKDIADTKYGPFIGMNVYSPTTLADLKNFEVKNDPHKEDALNYVMICNSVGWCDSIKTEEGETGTRITNYNGVNYQTLKTIFVPPGYKVDVFHKEKSVTTKHSGPLYGPIRQQNIQNCYSDWNVIVITPLELGIDGTKMLKLCSPVDNYCTQIEPGAEMETEEIGFFDYFKSSPVQCKPSLEYGALNMDIPQGRRVIISKGSAKLGPFTGPTFYPKLVVDKLSIKVEDLWVDKKAKRHRLAQVAVPQQQETFPFERQQNQINIPQKRHYHPITRYQQPTNQTMEEAIL